jgi:hypothetical protein
MWSAKHLLTDGTGFMGSHFVDRLSLIEAGLALISCFSGLPERFCVMIGQALLLCRQGSVVCQNRFRAAVKEARRRRWKDLKRSKDGKWLELSKAIYDVTSKDSFAKE